MGVTPHGLANQRNRPLCQSSSYGVLGGIQTHVSGFAGQCDVQASLQGRYSFYFINNLLWVGELQVQQSSQLHHHRNLFLSLIIQFD